MLYRGITVTYEAIRGWCLKFAQGYANKIRKQRPKPGDKWHLDEVVIKIKGEQFYLWRAVDGTVKSIRNSSKKTLWPVELRPIRFMRSLTSLSAIVSDRSVGSSLLDILKRSVCAGEDGNDRVSVQRRTESAADGPLI